MTARYCFPIALFLVEAACTTPPAHHRDASQTTSVIPATRALAEQIPRDLAREGPTAWLPHFVRSPAFFMISDGQLAFSSYASAESALPTIARSLRAVDLRWQQLRIDSLSPDFAVIASPFAERLTDSMGQVRDIAGYFTAVAERVDSGWQLRDLHWSLAHGSGQ